MVSLRLAVSPHRHLPFLPVSSLTCLLSGFRQVERSPPRLAHAPARRENCAKGEFKGDEYDGTG